MGYGRGEVKLTIEVPAEANAKAEAEFMRMMKELCLRTVFLGDVREAKPEGIAEWKQTQQDTDGGRVQEGAAHG